MKKKFLSRGLFGFPIGIAIGQIMLIIVSLTMGKGHFLAVTPELLELAGSEIRAVILQTVLCGIIGFIFAGSSIIWELSSWSILRQSATYFLITALTMLPIAYFANWMEHSMRGVLSFLLVFLIIFLIVWLVNYIMWKNKITKMNDKVKHF